LKQEYYEARLDVNLGPQQVDEYAGRFYAAEEAYYQSGDLLLPAAEANAREQAMLDEFAGIQEERKTKQNTDTDALATWKTPLDDKIAAAKAAKAAWEAAKKDLRQKEAQVTKAQAEFDAVPAG